MSGANAQRAHGRQIRIAGCSAGERARPPPARPAAIIAVEARVGPRMQIVAARGAPESDGISASITGMPGSLLPRRQRAPRLLHHFQRAHDALRVGRRQPRGHLGIALAQDAREAPLPQPLGFAHANARARPRAIGGMGDRPSSRALK